VRCQSKSAEVVDVPELAPVFDNIGAPLQHGAPPVKVRAVLAPVLHGDTKSINLNAPNDQKSPEMDLHNCDIARKVAEQRCNRGDMDCLWYHGNWELLKSLGVVSTSGIHAAEICALLEAALSEKKSTPRILLSGSTDATLIKLLMSACRENNCSPEIMAVDICATPLEFMCQYARENMLAFSSVRADILEFNADSNYDIILTHAFMGNFDEAGRVRLVRKWASMLNEGGCVVTVQRVRPQGSPPVVRFSADQSKHFINAALVAADAEGLQAGDRDRVEVAAREFTENFMSHSVTSKEALNRLFLESGLVFRHLEYKSLQTRANLGGPSVPSGGEYAFIIAERKVSI
jgi:SAM-dependent methyltransferase